MPAEGLPASLWVAEIPAVGERIRLGPEESKYVARVCRVRAGEGIAITDGAGAIGRALVIEAARDVVIEVAERERAEDIRAATFLCGAPDRGRADWLVEKLAELGVTRFQPIDCERARWSSAEARIDRWRRLAVAALQQSRRAWLLAVREPLPLDEALATLNDPGRPSAARYVADPEGAPAFEAAPPARVVTIVGPAEGFSPSERERLTAAGWVGISLSDSRLRTETAAIALASWWSAGGAASGSNSVSR